MAESTKKLYRSQKEKVIAGVAGGVAEFFSIDPTVVRIIFVVLGLLHGFGILLYIILALVMPQKQTEEGEQSKEADKKSWSDNLSSQAETIVNGVKSKAGGTKYVFGTLLLFLGVFLLAKEFFPFYIRFDILGPTIIILIGIFLMIKSGKK